LRCEDSEVPMLTVNRLPVCVETRAIRATVMCRVKGECWTPGAERGHHLHLTYHHRPSSRRPNAHQSKGVHLITTFPSLHRLLTCAVHRPSQARRQVPIITLSSCPISSTSLSKSYLPTRSSLTSISMIR
jgi:hypothetical protein